MLSTTIQQTLVEEFDTLLTEGRSFLGASYTVDEEFDQQVYDEIKEHYFRFRTRSLNLLQRVCGEQSEHYRQLRRIAEDKRSAMSSQFLSTCIGVVQAARDDYCRGLLFDLRALIAAELLGDFIDQAEMLVSQNYYVPAASLAGAVLEDSLRKLCINHGIPIPAKTTINALNVELAKKSVYNALVQKRITALADIRNNADHGRTDQFTRQDVEDMIQYLRRFTADYLH